MDLTTRIEILEAKLAAIDTEVDAIALIQQSKEKINRLAQTVAILTRTVKALFLAMIGAGLIAFGDFQLQDKATSNDDPALWTSRVGIGLVLYSAFVITNQEAIVMTTVLGWLASINPWKK